MFRCKPALRLKGKDYLLRSKTDVDEVKVGRYDASRDLPNKPGVRWLPWLVTGDEQECEEELIVSGYDVVRMLATLDGKEPSEKDRVE